MIKFNDYKNYLLKDKVILKSQQRFVSSGKITSYPYGYKGKNALV